MKPSSIPSNEETYRSVCRELDLERNKRDVLKRFLTQIDIATNPVWASYLGRELTASRIRLNRLWARRSRVMKQLNRENLQRQKRSDADGPARVSSSGPTVPPSHLMHHSQAERQWKGQA